MLSGLFCNAIRSLLRPLTIHILPVQEARANGHGDVCILQLVHWTVRGLDRRKMQLFIDFAVRGLNRYAFDRRRFYRISPLPYVDFK